MASEFSSYRAGERDNTPRNYSDFIEAKQIQHTMSKDWQDYRAGERGDPVTAPIVQSFSAPVAPVPQSPTPPPPTQTTTNKVKSATPEIILFDESLLPAEILTDLIFENIGGQELLSVSRHDTINGDYISNQLIKNLTFLNQEFSSKRILSLQNTSDKYFSNFGIKLESKIPFEGNGPSGSNVYLDSNQNIIIELVNLDIDEQVEVQLGIGGTIYTILLGASE